MNLKLKEMLLPADGIFTKMTYEFPEWIDKRKLDIMLYTNYGDRIASPIAQSMYNTSTLFITEMACMLQHYYKYRWDKLTALLSLEYSPIDPFRQLTEENNQGAKTNAVEVMHNTSDSDTRTDNLQQVREKGTSTTSTRTDDLQNEETRNLKTVLDSDTNNGVYGFNSALVTPSDESDVDNTTTDTGTVSNHNTGTQATITVDSGQDTFKDTGTQKHDIKTSGMKGTTEAYTEQYLNTIQRHGNIGNIPTQSLITAEINLWEWNYIQQLIHDVVDMISLPIYD